MGLRGRSATRCSDHRRRVRRRCEVQVRDQRTQAQVCRRREDDKYSLGAGDARLNARGECAPRSSRRYSDKRRQACACAAKKRTIRWRDGTNAVLSSRFARVRVHSAHDRIAAKETVPEEWLLIEWPPDEKAPTKFWLSTCRV